MSIKILHKYSSTANAVPSTSSLDLREIAINTNDGKLYIKKSDGTNESIVEVGKDADTLDGHDSDYFQRDLKYVNDVEYGSLLTAGNRIFDFITGDGHTNFDFRIERYYTQDTNDSNYQKAHLINKGYDGKGNLTLQYSDYNSSDNSYISSSYLSIEKDGIRTPNLMKVGSFEIDSSAPMIMFNDTDSDPFWVVSDGYNFSVRRKDTNGDWTYPFLLRDDSQSGYLWGNEILTVSNYTTTLDSRYVKKAGDTVTGELILSPSNNFFEMKNTHVDVLWHSNSDSNNSWFVVAPRKEDDSGWNWANDWGFHTSLTEYSPEGGWFFKQPLKIGDPYGTYTTIAMFEGTSTNGRHIEPDYNSYGSVNDILKNSIYNINNSDITDSPRNSGWGFLHTLIYQNNTDYGVQMYYDMNSGDRLFYRNRASGTWGAWKEIVEKENITSQVKIKQNVYDYDATDGQTEFTISGVIASNEELQVFLNGIKMRPSAYTVTDDGTDTKVTLSEGVQDDSWVEIVYLTAAPK